MSMPVLVRDLLPILTARKGEWCTWSMLVTREERIACGLWKLRDEFNELLFVSQSRTAMVKEKLGDTFAVTVALAELFGGSRVRLIVDALKHNEEVTPTALALRARRRQLCSRVQTTLERMIVAPAPLKPPAALDFFADMQMFLLAVAHDQGLRPDDIPLAAEEKKQIYGEFTQWVVMWFP